MRRSCVISVMQPPFGIASRALITRLRIAVSSWFEFGIGEAKIFLHVEGEFDVLAYRAPKHVCDRRDELVDVHGPELQRLKTREREHAFRQSRRAIRRRLDSVHDAVDIAKIAPRDPLANEVETANDACQQIVEVMGDAPGQLANRLHFLRLTQLRFGVHEFLCPLRNLIGERCIQALQVVGWLALFPSESHESSATSLTSDSSLSLQVGGRARSRLERRLPSLAAQDRNDHERGAASVLALVAVGLVEKDSFASAKTTLDCRLQSLRSTLDSDRPRLERASGNPGQAPHPTRRGRIPRSSTSMLDRALRACAGCTASGVSSALQRVRQADDEVALIALKPEVVLRFFQAQKRSNRRDQLFRFDRLYQVGVRDVEAGLRGLAPIQKMKRSGAPRCLGVFA